jgi:hypothetical protein
MLSIKDLRKQLTESRKTEMTPVKSLKREDLVKELEKYKKPEAPAPIKAPVEKESALDRVASRRRQKPVVEEIKLPELPKPKRSNYKYKDVVDETQAKPDEKLVKPQDVKIDASLAKEVRKHDPAKSKKGTPEMKERMAKLREARMKKKSAE